MKTFRKELEFDDKIMQFFHRMHVYGNAMFHGPNAYVPEMAQDFVVEQYNRFRFPHVGMSKYLHIVAPAMIIDLVDYDDPYLMLWDASDVTMTHDWETYTYEVTEDKEVYWELDPERLETFRYIPYQADEFFNKHMAMPGLDAFPSWLGGTIKAYVDQVLAQGFSAGSYYLHNIPTPNDVYDDLSKRILNEDGLTNESRVNAYFDLALWASTLWIFGPLGRDYRMSTSDIMEVCLTDGECIVYDGEAISPEFYRKTDRPIRSCYKCGIGGWCVELSMDDNATCRYICEGCLSRGMKPRNGATCGTKFCKYFECPHNAYYNAGQGAVRDVMRTHGQLAGRAAAKKEALLQATEQKRLLGT